MKTNYAYGKLGIREQLRRSQLGPLWTRKPKVLPIDKVIAGLFRIQRTRKNSADIEIITDQKGVAFLRRELRGMKRWKRTSQTDRALLDTFFHGKSIPRKLTTNEDTMKHKLKIQSVTQGRSFWWRLIAGNGRVLATSETYDRRDNRDRAALKVSRQLGLTLVCKK